MRKDIQIYILQMVYGFSYITCASPLKDDEGRRMTKSGSGQTTVFKSFTAAESSLKFSVSLANILYCIVCGIKQFNYIFFVVCSITDVKKM